MENWRKVGKNSFYEVSDCGRVRNTITGLVLKTGIDRYGYKKIHLRKVDDKTNFHTTIHRLVALAWVDGWFEGAQVNHKNGIKFDNAPSNLEWVTVKENITHSFDHLLNANTNPVSLTDKETGIELRFRSIKAVGRFLEIYPSTLVPLIRHSNSNPIFNKYVVQVLDESAAFGLANTTNFGSKVFVLDSLTNQVSEYPSLLLASYWTGVRSLTTFSKTTDVHQNVGYYFAWNRARLPSGLVVDKEAVSAERVLYLNTPYVKRNHVYELHDYYLNKTWSFLNVGEVVKFVNTNCKRQVDNKKVSLAIGAGKKDNRTGLLRGYGIRSSLDNFPWFPYREEVIITNRENRIALPVYRVEIDGVSKDVIGLLALYNLLNTGSDKPLSQLTEASIVRSSNIPNLSVVRLVKPIETKTKI